MVAEDSSLPPVNHRSSSVVSCSSRRRSSISGASAGPQVQATEASSFVRSSNSVDSEKMNAATAATERVEKPPASLPTTERFAAATAPPTYTLAKAMTDRISSPAAATAFAASLSEASSKVEPPEAAVRSRPGREVVIQGREVGIAAPALSDARRVGRAHKSSVQRVDIKKSYFQGPGKEATHSLRELKKLHVLPTGQRAENRQVFEVLKTFMKAKKVLYPCMAFRVPLKSSFATLDISGNENMEESGGPFQSEQTQDTATSLSSRPRRPLPPSSAALALSPDPGGVSSRSLDVSVALSPSSSFNGPSVSTSTPFPSSASPSAFCWSPSLILPAECSTSPPSRSISSSTSSFSSPLRTRPTSSASFSTTYVIVDCSPASGLLTPDTVVYLSGASLQRLRRVQLMALVNPNSAYGRRAGISSYQQVFDRRPDFPCLEQDDQLLLREAPVHVRGFDLTSETSQGSTSLAASIENTTEAPPVAVIAETPGGDKTDKAEKEEQGEVAFPAGLGDAFAEPRVESLGKRRHTAAVSAEDVKGDSLTTSRHARTGIRTPAVEAKDEQQAQQQALSQEKSAARATLSEGADEGPRCGISEKDKAKDVVSSADFQKTLNISCKEGAGGQAESVDTDPRPVFSEGAVPSMFTAAGAAEALGTGENTDASGAAHTTGDCRARRDERSTDKATNQLQSFCLKWYKTQEGARTHLRGCASAGNVHGGTSPGKDIYILNSSTGKMQETRTSCGSRGDSSRSSSRTRNPGSSWNTVRSDSTIHAGKRNMSDGGSVSRSSSSSGKSESRNRITAGSSGHVSEDISRKNTVRRSVMGVFPKSAHCSSSSSVGASSAQPEHGASTEGCHETQWEEAVEDRGRVAERPAAGEALSLASVRSAPRDPHTDKEGIDEVQQRLPMRCGSRGHLHTTVKGVSDLQPQQRRRTLCIGRRRDAHDEVAVFTAVAPGERAAAVSEDEASLKAETEERAIAEKDVDPTPGVAAEGDAGFGRCAAAAGRAAKEETGFLWCDAKGFQRTTQGGARDSTGRERAEGTLEGPRRRAPEGEAIGRTVTAAGGGIRTGRATRVAAERDWRMRPAHESEKVRLQRLDGETLFRVFVGPYLQRKLGKRISRSAKKDGIEKREERGEYPSERRGEGDKETDQVEGSRRTRSGETLEEETNQPKATLVLYPGKELVIRDVTFVVWAADPAGVPGLLDEDTVIYICLDPYGEYRRVHFVPFSDTLPTTYEFDFYEDYLKLFLLENKWRNFRRGDVYSYRGVEFKLIATEPSVSAGARVGPATVVYHEGTMQPTVMDVLPADVLYHIRRLPARMQPAAIIFAAQRLDPEILMRVVPSTSIMRSRRGLNEQTAERLREKLVTPFSFAAYLKKHPDLCCRVSPSSAAHSTEKTSTCTFNRRLSHSSGKQSTCWTGNYMLNSNAADEGAGNSVNKESFSGKAAHVAAGSQGTENKEEETMLVACASAASGESVDNIKQFEKPAAVYVVQPERSDVAHVENCGSAVVQTRREDLVEHTRNTVLEFDGREEYCSSENAECNEEELRRFERPCCTVCTLPMEERDASILLFCGHVFHWQCIHLWLRYNSTCPNCRAEITELFRQHEESLWRQRASESNRDEYYGESRSGETTSEENAFGLVSTIRRWISTAMFGAIEL